MKNLCLLLTTFFILNSCSNKGTLDTDSNNIVEQTLTDKSSSNYWHFLGIYEGTKEEAYDQQLNYKIYLWQKEKKYVGYLYYLWYVTDFNYSENHARFNGKKKNDVLQLKGEFDDEPFVIEIKDSITSNITISIHFPTNYSQRVDDFHLSKNEKESPTIALSTFPESNMNLFIDSLMQINMSHKGY